MTKTLEGSILVAMLVAVAAPACALHAGHASAVAPAIRVTERSSPSWIPIRSVDEVPLGIWDPLVREGRRGFTMERLGEELRLWGLRETGERYPAHRLIPAPNGRFAAQDMGGIAWFVRDGDDVLLGFSACYLEGPMYRYRRH